MSSMPDPLEHPEEPVPPAWELDVPVDLAEEVALAPPASDTPPPPRRIIEAYLSQMF
jgi:hypothetical protein